MSSEVPDIELNKEICRELIDNALLGLGIIQNKKLVYANRSLADITGHTLENMLALSANDFMSMIYPDDQHSILGSRDRRHFQQQTAPASGVSNYQEKWGHCLDRCSGKFHRISGKNRYAGCSPGHNQPQEC